MKELNEEVCPMCGRDCIGENNPCEIFDMMLTSSIMDDLDGTDDTLLPFLFEGG
jgi:hypothetical protein